MNYKTVEEYILSFPNTWLDYPFGEEIAVYKVGPNPDIDNESKMFALIRVNKSPIQLSLKCDPLLSQVLRDKYEEVLPGYNLNKKHWNTLILSGQLRWEDVQDLIRHSYDLVSQSISKN